MSRDEAIAYLVADDPGAYVPCSRYGRNTEECAPVAAVLAEILAAETGEPMTTDNLEHAMGLVVNDHDDVAYILAEYATRAERKYLGLTKAELMS